MIRLFGYWRSSATWRVRAALELKRIDYEIVPVNLLKSEQKADAYRLKNPLAQVPVLEIREGGGVRSMSQSVAIIELLEELYPEPALLPTDPWQRARARQIAEVINSGIQPLHNLTVLDALANLGGDREAWARGAIERGFDALEALAELVPGPWLVSDGPTIAEIFLVPAVYAARRNGVDLNRYPRLALCDAVCRELPAFLLSHPDRQPDAPV